ncbi:MAG: hypothetical protein IPH04_14850 [Saprospirales bacterium]|nr:hypothetical protein [Saprospirales bacterium]
MKNLNELNALIAASINAMFSALDDKKIDFPMGKFLDPILKAAPAIQDIGEVGRENAALEIPGRDQLNRDFVQGLPAVPQSVADDLARVQGGFWAAYRVGYNLGKETARAELVEQLRSGELSVSDLIDQE